MVAVATSVMRASRVANDGETRETRRISELGNRIFSFTVELGVLLMVGGEFKS